MSIRTKILSGLCAAVIIALCLAGCGDNSNVQISSRDVSAEETTREADNSSEETTKETDNSSEETEQATTAKLQQTEESENDDDGSGIGSDFKAAMDSYEEFMDEYVEFMKKYNDNPSDISLLADYADYMSDYANFVKDFEKWENEDLSTAEAAYYIEVQSRVSKKLLEIAE